MAGRRPKPTHLKLVTGNPGKRAINKSEPNPTRGIPAQPNHLSPQARLAWDSFSLMLDKIGVLTEADGAALEQISETYAEVVSLRADIATNGRFQTVATKSGDEMERLRPAYSALMDADRRLKAWLVEFGVTPAARGKVKVNGATEKQEDPSSAYF